MIAQNISIRELARRAEVNPSAVSKVLNGKRDATVDFYVKLAEVFDAVPEMLQVAGVLPTAEGMKGSFLQLFKGVLALTPEKQEEAQNYLRYLVEQDRQQQSLPGNENNDPANVAGEAG